MFQARRVKVRTYSRQFISAIAALGLLLSTTIALPAYAEESGSKDTASKESVNKAAWQQLQTMMRHRSADRDGGNNDRYMRAHWRHQQQFANSHHHHGSAWAVANYRHGSQWARNGFRRGFGPGGPAWAHNNYRHGRSAWARHDFNRGRWNHDRGGPPQFARWNHHRSHHGDSQFAWRGNRNRDFRGGPPQFAWGGQYRGNFGQRDGGFGYGQRGGFAQRDGFGPRDGFRTARPPIRWRPRTALCRSWIRPASRSISTGQRRPFLVRCIEAASSPRLARSTHRHPAARNQPVKARAAGKIISTPTRIWPVCGYIAQLCPSGAPTKSSNIGLRVSARYAKPTKTPVEAFVGRHRGRFVSSVLDAGQTGSFVPTASLAQVPNPAIFSLSHFLSPEEQNHGKAQATEETC